VKAWYVRPGAVRVASAVVALYVAITSSIRFLTERGTSSGVFNLLGMFIGVAALVAIALSVRSDRRSSDASCPGGSADPDSQ